PKPFSRHNTRTNDPFSALNGGFHVYRPRAAPSTRGLNGPALPCAFAISISQFLFPDTPQKLQQFS
ncbi:MAG TPA: hypothetical protein PLA90_01425, partial [Candidatus Sumerlaeota bacterium]|nr:hypothetical protein [Candidatus Sumerlaeota bacterium]